MYGVRVCLIDVVLLFFSTLHTFRKMKILTTLTVGRVDILTNDP